MFNSVTKNRGILFALIGMVTLAGCAHQRPLRLQARDDFERQEFSAAEAKLLTPEVVGENKAKLVTLVELGTVAHNKREYEKSLFYFQKANELAEQLFTQSISKKILSAVYNDNSKNYAGLDYERSMIHFYLVMNNLMLAQEGKSIAWEIPEVKDGETIVFSARKSDARQFSAKEIAEYQSRGRSEVLAWDSFLDTIRASNQGEALYKDDIGAKLLGAYVHRMSGRSDDKNIAKVLYDNANELLVKSYSLYPTFNSKSSEFGENFRSLASQDYSEVTKNFVAPTEHYEKLSKFVNFSADLVTKGDGNALVVLESGMVPEKKERIQLIGLGTLVNQIEDPGLKAAVTSIGLEVLVKFMPLVGVAGLIEGGDENVAITEKNSSGEQHLVVSKAGAEKVNNGIDSAVGFKFKLPDVAKVPNDVNYTVEFTNLSDASKVSVPMALVNPINDFARREIDVKSTAVMTKTGIRVGMKYLAVLVPSYMTYKKLKEDGNPDFVATMAATAAWMAGKAAVDATEAADIRAWNTLPQSISMMEAKLPPGRYAAVAQGSRGSEKWSENLGEVEVSASRPNILKLRAMYSPQRGEAGKTVTAQLK